MFIAIYWVNLKVANQQKTLHRRNPAFAGLFIHAPEAIRTPDARFRKPTLYPLSYRSSYVFYDLTIIAFLIRNSNKLTINFSEILGRMVYNQSIDNFK